jgi:hypothetical protein
MLLTVDRLRDDGDAWDRFVRSSPDGTVFHLSAWKRIVTDVFRHTPHYLLAIEGDEIRGALPLFEVRGLLTGRVLISTPYAAYGGLCGTDPAARAALLARARELAEQPPGRSTFAEVGRYLAVKQVARRCTWCHTLFTKFSAL